MVYLAFHRGGISQAECALALWPDRAVAASTMHSTSSDARHALGFALLPRRGARLELAVPVSTDVDRFAALAARGHPDRLLDALRLVRGVPFGGLRHADWAVLEGTQADIEGLVVETALRGAADLMALGRASEAEWAVRRALLVSPFDERLYRALLRATDALGQRARLHATMAQLIRLAGGAEQPWTRGPTRDNTARLGAVHPETVALYHDLLAGTPATGAHPSRQ